MSAAPPRRTAPIRGISAVLPARNEQGNLTQVVETTLEALGDAVPSFEVIIVDDGSTDATGRLADDLASAHSAVRVVHHAKHLGYGSAWRSGIADARLQYTFFVDADRQFNPIELERLIQWDDRHDLVLGYRLRRNDPLHRRIFGLLFRLTVRLLFGIKNRDVNCGFKLIRTSVLNGLSLESRGALISTEIIYRARQRGADVREVGVRHYPRRSGKSSAITFASTLRAIREIARLWKHINQEQRQAIETARSAAAMPTSQDSAEMNTSTSHVDSAGPEPTAATGASELLAADRETPS